MVTLLEFIKEEVNKHTKEVIFRSIEAENSGNKAKIDLIFNKYSLEILFSEGKVVIFDDVFTEDQPLSLKIEDFLKANQSLSSDKSLFCFPLI